MSGLREIRERMARAALDAGRVEGDVVLVAVSKTFPVEALEAVYGEGQRVFGESRQQEAEEKVAKMPEDVEWHFIGRVQRNKLRKIVRDFSVIHAVDSLKLARAVGELGRELGREISVFLQINVAGEESKGGFTVEECYRALPEILALSGVRVLGLMQIPPDDERAGYWFGQLRELRDLWCEEFANLGRGLSMGMSGDFEEAIRQGATHIRVGSAIFGGRAYRVEGELG